MDFRKGIKSVEIEGEKIYLKKSPLGYKVVHPIKNEDGSINWKNLISGGSWWNLAIIIILVLVLIGATYEYTNTLKIANECLKQPFQVNFSGLK